MYGRGELIRVIESVRDDALGKDEAMGVWRGLEEGRWSIVETLEREGRRFILARANEPQYHRLKTWTPRERQVVALAARGHSNKTIAYSLGLAPSTVATHLTAARKKLGVGTRLELVQVFVQLGSPP